ncbi:MAG: hypothetical protein EPO07_17405 [Verrucomicrobia bacterium]|nr:MAG: hypothetical protein EPO07_17405 [Verrucomicrobiota bacterium]
MNPTPTTSQSFPARSAGRFAATIALLALALGFASSSVWAQTITMRSQPLRFTVPKGTVYSNATVLTIVTSGNPTPTNHLAVTGIPGSGNANAWLSQTEITSNATTLVTLNYTNDATIAGGTYDLAVEGTGDSTYRLPVPVIVAYVWSGVDFTNAVSTNFTSTGNWKGGVAPGAADDVVFNDGGGQAAATGPTNIIVAASATVNSIRFASEASGSRAHNMEIQNGATLSVTGSGLSFSLHRDTKLVAQPILATISGGGTLSVANSAAQIGVLLDGQQNATWDMRNLNNFVADVSRIGLGNYRIWPNYYTNGYVSPAGAGIANPPTRFVPLVFLAKTNIIKCSWTDPNAYADNGIRDYALEIGNDEASGTTANITFRLGISNAFFLDSLCYSHSGKGGGGNSFIFNSAGSYALYRGIGGGRMSVWAQGDASGNASSGSNVRGTVVDFGNGQVDAMVDKLYLGRSRTNTTGITIQGTLTLGGASLGSIFDVNTAYLGSQDADNLGTPTQAISGPTGTVNVNSNATFKVNRTLHLGYTTAAASGTPTYPENCSGILNISASGTVMASNILCGGVTKLSVNDNIFMNKGNLIVTNGIGTDYAVNNLIMTNGSTLTLYNVSTTVPTIYAKTFSAPSVGPATLLNIPTLSATYPVTIPLIAYTNAGPSLGGLAQGTLPSGVRITSIADNTVNKTIDITFNTGVANVLVWRGNVNNTWDTVTKNWVTLGGGIATNFVDGDSVIFDDTLTGSASVNVSGTVSPGQSAATYGIVVSNTTAAYSFSGGSVGGSVTLHKVNSGSLAINTTFTPGVVMDGGSLTGSGSVGQTFAGYGTTMTGFNGTVSGGLTASNAAVLITSLATVSGGLTVSAGALTNNGIIAGGASIADNVYLTNGGTMNITVPWLIQTNSVLVNNGLINQSAPGAGDFGLTVNGLLMGTGTINAVQNGNSNRVVINPGGQLMIGNAPGQIAAVNMYTRLDLSRGSLTMIDVDPSTTNDIINITQNGSTAAGKVNFMNNSFPGVGGTLFINRLGATPFTLATTIVPIYSAGSPLNAVDNANPLRPVVIPAPGTNLVWDLTDLVTNLTLRVVGPPTLTNTFDGTNFVFSWSDVYRSWSLQAQTNGLDVGLNTNWYTISGSQLTNFNTQPVNLTNPAVFYRMTYP